VKACRPGPRTGPAPIFSDAPRPALSGPKVARIPTVMTRAGPLAALLAPLLLAPLVLALLPGGVARADEVPTFLVKGRYGESRTVLVAQGWQPAPSSADPARCARGFENLCATYPETEYCAGGGLPRCVFLWRDAGGMLIELRTLGREDPVVEIVRCRTSCRAARPERASWPTVSLNPARGARAPYLRG
jgi:hypothetical protein